VDEFKRNLKIVTYGEAGGKGKGKHGMGSAGVWFVRKIVSPQPDIFSGLQWSGI